MSETPLHFKTITELAALIKSKTLSPVEATEAMLTRIQEQDPQYKSYATVMAEEARASAQTAERAIRPNGVPIAVKDLCFTTWPLPPDRGARAWPRWAPPKL